MTTLTVENKAANDTESLPSLSTTNASWVTIDFSQGDLTLRINGDELLERDKKAPFDPAESRSVLGKISRLTSESDLADFEAELKNATDIAIAGSLSLVVDFQSLDHIASSVITSLEKARSRLEMPGLDLSISDPVPEQFQIMLELCNWSRQPADVTNPESSSISNSRASAA